MARPVDAEDENGVVVVTSVVVFMCQTCSSDRSPPSLLLPLPLLEPEPESTFEPTRQLSLPEKSTAYFSGIGSNRYIVSQ